MKNTDEIIIFRNQQSDLVAVAKALEKHGVCISESDLLALENIRTKSLSAHGRVEFGKSALPTLAKVFASSPYIDSENCATVLAELLDAFYYFRGECDGLISDKELMTFMRREFDRSAAGDISYLTGTAMERLCSKLKGKNYY